MPCTLRAYKSGFINFMIKAVRSLLTVFCFCRLISHKKFKRGINFFAPDTAARFYFAAGFAFFPL